MTARTILARLEKFVQQPNFYSTLSIHNSRDMGYQSNFITVTLSGSGRGELKGKGDSVQAALSAALRVKRS